MELLVHCIGDLHGGGEIGIAQQQRHRLESAEIDRGVALDHGPVGNQADIGGIHFLPVGAGAGGVSSQNKRSLRLGVDLSIRAVQRAHQQHAAFEAAGIANGRNGHVELAPGRANGGSDAVIKTAATFFTTTAVLAGISTPIFCMALASVCTVKMVCCVSPVPRRPDHQAVAHQHVVSHTFNTGDVPHQDLAIGIIRERHRRQHRQHNDDAPAAKEPWTGSRMRSRCVIQASSSIRIQ